jgi:putative DNA methylase
MVTQQNPPRLLIEEWLPAAAIGVECMRERATGQNPPNARLHIWWARRPLTASRAAVLGSLLPADFPRDVFERLLGFWGKAEDVVQAQKILDYAKASGFKVSNPHGERAFKRPLRQDDIARAHKAVEKLWGDGIKVIDPMAGGGSIPLESARLGFDTIANEYNPVACSVLEARLIILSDTEKNSAEELVNGAPNFEKDSTSEWKGFIPRPVFCLPTVIFLLEPFPAPTRNFIPLLSRIGIC